ncbi:hypothetical protein RSW84_29940, partial [Escherichia coli]|uniref:hypothetical protein n=1 Tax=Escherichia coli TaxID=562 RepID=UPI0028E053A5
FHGGTTQKVDPKSRYAIVNASPRLRELMDAAEADPDPLNLLPELALLRALVQDYVERYDALTAALLGWHESYQQGKNE